MKNFKINEAEVEQKSDLLFEYRPQAAFIRASRIANEQIANEQIASIGGHLLASVRHLLAWQSLENVYRKIVAHHFSTETASLGSGELAGSPRSC